MRSFNGVFFLDFDFTLYTLLVVARYNKGPLTPVRVRRLVPRRAGSRARGTTTLHAALQAPIVLK